MGQRFHSVFWVNFISLYLVLYYQNVFELSKLNKILVCGKTIYNNQIERK